MTAETMTAETMPADAPQQPAAEEVRLSLAEALQFALHLMSRGDAVAAVKIYERAIEITPEDADLLHFYGVALHQTQKSQAGLDLIRSSLERRPDLPGWWNNYGNVLKDVDRIDDAIDAYRRAIELAPNFAEPYNNLGLIQRNRCNFDISEECFVKAITLNPENAEAHFNFGNLLVARGRILEGTTLLFKAVTLAPENASSRRALAYAYGQLGANDKARDIYAELLESQPDDPISLHHFAAVSGDAPKRASDAYVRETFNAFAPRFDEKLQHLGYRAPGLVTDALAAQTGLPGRPLRIADAGCGTGLCGPGLRERAGLLVGVDLSPAMLGLAHARQLYDELVEQELTAFLAQRPAQFDAVVCADTFCYFGDLTEAFAAAQSSLEPGGVFVFTVEALEADATGHRLAHNGRYAHSQAYVGDALEEAGLMAVSIRRDILREESGKDVEGLIVVAQKPPAG